jgi:hypothetical protein
MRVSQAALSALLLLSIPLLMLTPPAQADVVYTEVLKGAGGAKSSNAPVKSQVYVNGKALRRETQSAQNANPPDAYFPSSAARSGYGGLEILRLDSGVLWTMTGSGQVERQALNGQASPSPKAKLARMADLADIQVLSSQPVLRRTGFMKDINGYRCDHLFATVTCEARDRSTGEKGTLILMNDLWVASDVPGAREIREFRQSLGQIYGLDEYFCPDAALFAEALPAQAKQLGELTARIDGLPVSSTMTAKFKTKTAAGKTQTDLLYSLATDMLDIETIAYSPNTYEMPQ